MEVISLAFQTRTLYEIENGKSNRSISNNKGRAMFTLRLGGLNSKKC